MPYSRVMVNSSGVMVNSGRVMVNSSGDVSPGILHEKYMKST